MFYAHPYSSHERSTNEHFNRLLKEFLSKVQLFNILSDDELQLYVAAVQENY